MPDTDVGDLRDVVDAINKMCDTMKTSTYCDDDDDCPEIDAGVSRIDAARVYPDSFDSAPEPQFDSIAEDVEDADVDITPEVIFKKVEIYNTARFDREDSVSPEESKGASGAELQLPASPEEVIFKKVEIYNTERWSDSTSQTSLPGQAEDATPAQGEPASEMYYTASSEVSLTSDTEVAEKGPAEDGDKGERKECVIAGHVAAMRERFESMTRTNTPCPDLARSLSPSFEVFRNVSPSPDRLA